MRNRPISEGLRLVLAFLVLGLITTTCGGSGGRDPTTPVISQVVPDTGRTFGAEPVDVIAATFRDDFSSTPLVYFGQDQATVTAVSPTKTISVLTPPHAVAETVDVRVEGTGTNPPETAVLVGGFTFVDAPTIVLIAPNWGLLAGGTFVTIQTANFRDDFTMDTPIVRFDAILASNVTPIGAEALTVTTPPHFLAETVSVEVQSTGVVELAVRTGGFAYVDCPSIRLSCDITGANPDNGPLGGGNQITVTGASFCDVNPRVTFGLAGPTVAATFVTDQELMVIVPPATTTGQVELFYDDDIGCFAVPIPFCCYTYN